MIKEKFEEIAEQLGCDYNYSEERHVSLVSGNIPISYHSLTLTYKTVKIELQYEFGGQNLASVKSAIETDKKVPDFKVKTRSQIKRLFSRNKSPFIVQSKDDLFDVFILNVLDDAGYNEIATKTTFDPELSGVNTADHYKLSTNFYLGFDDKENSILPSINLYKRIIDKILR